MLQASIEDNYSKSAKLLQNVSCFNLFEFNFLNNLINVDLPILLVHFVLLFKILFDIFLIDFKNCLSFTPVRVIAN